MPSDAPDHATLLQLFHGCPVGLVQMDQRGRIDILNRRAMQMLQPLCAGGALSNFFELTAAWIPELDRALEEVRDATRVFVLEQRLELSARPGQRPDKVLRCSLHKTDRDAYLAVLTDVTFLEDGHREMLRKANRDELTGLLNRRAFLDASVEAIERYHRYEQPVTLLFLDADHFKKVNDTHGHGVGDDVLRRIAELCQQSIRRVDHAGRLGGEEFAILMPGVGGDGAMVAAERLRRAVEGAEIVAAEAVLSITLSIGVAEMRGQLHTIDDLLEAADQALYAAKANGRNRVECA